MLFGFLRDIALIVIAWQLIDTGLKGSLSQSMLMLFSILLILFAIYGLLKRLGMVPSF